MSDYPYTRNPSSGILLPPIESNDSVRFCLKNGLELRESIERTVR